jgi:hypothetical protein
VSASVPVLLLLLIVAFCALGVQRHQHDPCTERVGRPPKKGPCKKANSDPPAMDSEPSVALLGIRPIHFFYRLEGFQVEIASDGAKDSVCSIQSQDP